MMMLTVGSPGRCLEFVSLYAKERLAWTILSASEDSPAEMRQIGHCLELSTESSTSLLRTR
jgi:hypothetical protein